jgi:hypothetical protein
MTHKLHTFVNCSLGRAMGIRWLKITNNIELWEATGEKPMIQSDPKKGELLKNPNM